MADSPSYPENDKDTLWLCNALDRRSFGELFYAIKEHFGSAIGLAEVDIEYERWTYEYSCSCCREDNGRYGDYYKITRRAQPDPDTVNHLIADLQRD